MEILKKGYCFEGPDQSRSIIIGEAVSHESGQTVYLCQELTGACRLMVWTAGEITGQRNTGEESLLRKDCRKVQENTAAYVSGTPGTEPGSDFMQASASVQREMAQEDTEQFQQTMMIRFLEASTCREKLEILDMMKGKLTDSMLESMAISMDYEPGGGSVEEKYYALERFLKTRNRYEGTRLR